MSARTADVVEIYHNATKRQQRRETRIAHTYGDATIKVARIEFERFHDDGDVNPFRLLDRAYFLSGGGALIPKDREHAAAYAARGLRPIEIGDLLVVNNSSVFACEERLGWEPLALGYPTSAVVKSFPGSTHIDTHVEGLKRWNSKHSPKFRLEIPGRLHRMCERGEACRCIPGLIETLLPEVLIVETDDHLWGGRCRCCKCKRLNELTLSANLGATFTGADLVKKTYLERSPSWA